MEWKGCGRNHRGNYDPPLWTNRVEMDGPDADDWGVRAALYTLKQVLRNLVDRAKAFVKLVKSYKYIPKPAVVIIQRSRLVAEMISSVRPGRRLRGKKLSLPEYSVLPTTKQKVRSTPYT
jgi:hypothetical protein